MNRQRQLNEFRPLAALLASAFLTCYGPASAAECTVNAPAQATPQATLVGVYTGEITPGGPVYRLPPVTVVASRNADTTRVAHAPQADRARQAGAKPARPAG